MTKIFLRPILLLTVCFLFSAQAMKHIKNKNIYGNIKKVTIPSFIPKHVHHPKFYSTEGSNYPSVQSNQAKTPNMTRGNHGKIKPQGHKSFIPNSSVKNSGFATTYFNTIESPLNQSARNYSIKREDEPLIKEQEESPKNIRKQLDKALHYLDKTASLSNLMRLVNILFVILGIKIAYTMYDAYTSIEIRMDRINIGMAKFYKKLPLIINNSFNYTSPEWNNDEVEMHILNFKLTNNTYNNRKITHQFYSALADTFKERSIKTVTSDDILNLITETESTLKEGIFKDGICINKQMNPLAQLYLDQTTQLFKGENAYILGTLGEMFHITQLNKTSIDYYVRKLNASWWRKALYSIGL